MSDITQPTRKISAAQWRLFFIVLMIGVAGITYHVLTRLNLDHSAALYVGLPFIFALGISLTPKSRTHMGATMKGLTIALLLSAPVFFEGFICIIMASPILYSVAALTVYIINRIQTKQNKNSTIQISAFTLLFALFALEGTHPQLTFERLNHTEYTKIIESDIATIRTQLSKPMRPITSRPVFLQIFPAPINVSGNGLAPGDSRKVEFTYHKWFVANTHKGSTIFTVQESGYNTIKFDIPHDDSYISHYLNWKSAEINLEPIESNKTRVSWKLSYERKLDPAWYFGPMQKYAVWLSAKVLVDHAATPEH